MPKYVMVNRRAGKFTEEAKLASRASIASAMSLVSSKAVLEDRAPKDLQVKSRRMSPLSHWCVGSFTIGDPRSSGMPRRWRRAPPP